MKTFITEILVFGYVTVFVGVLENKSAFVDVDTMSKRVRSKSLLKPKKLKRSLSPNSKRNSIPRTCKYPGKSNIVQYSVDILPVPSNTIVLKSNQNNQTSVKDISKVKKKDEKYVNFSSDEELDVVYDVQEEKKNKIYEVITVMSDDETPNKISYERIYADKPEDKIVEIPESTKNVNAQESNKIEVNNVQEVDLESKPMGNTVKKDSLVTKPDNTSKSNQNDNNGSDDDVVCLAVIDAKTKAEMKRANVEEICLSSDSESDITPVVPPMRLRIPAVPNYGNWSVDHFLSSLNEGNNSSFSTNNSSALYNSPYSIRNNLFPYLIEKKRPVFNSLLKEDGESSSTSTTKHASSDDVTPANSPKNLSADESSTSSLSDVDYQPNKDNFNSIDSDSTLSTLSSDSNTEKRIYWKADRQTRTKRQLMHEEYTTFGKKVHTGEIDVDPNTSLTFKVMSYNVLAQNLLEEHRYLYKHHDRGALGWAKRWSLIYRDIKEENPEILCLQEVEETFFSSHYSKLNDLGYRWLYKKRTGTYQDGVAIFYKASVFEESEHAKVEYYQPGVSVLDRHNVGLVIRLKLKKSPNHAIVVSTTHLLYNPRRSDVKLAQAQMLLAEIDRLAFNKETSSYYPVILTGDFNLKPRNGVYRLITEGVMTYEGMSRRSLNSADDTNVVPKTLLPCRLGITDQCQHIEVLDARSRGETTSPSTKVYHTRSNKYPKQQDCTDDRFQSGSLKHSFNFQSVYPHVKDNGQKEASTHHDQWITVDYIFYSCQKEKEDGSLELLSRLRLPTQNECESLLRFLPNFAFGSDHLPLVGKFLFKFQRDDCTDPERK